ncbi:MAG: AEC family transporter [Senegalia sp. (in: firmicutes)]|uniref:AEC family transporter n=1 Tax=Senegalia sp. (in: firmicutes) TaxID=1924098 RepID=UPI003F9501E3
MNIFFHILTNNITPIFFLILIGFVLNKIFDLDMFTLSKLNFYVFVPSFLLVNIYNADLDIKFLKVFVFGILLVAFNYILGILISLLLGYSNSLKNAFINSITFINAGNIGIPLITLIFINSPYVDMAIATHIIIYLTQNIFTNTIGFYNASRGNNDWRRSIIAVFKIPVIYIIPIAFSLKYIPYDFSENPLWTGIVYAKSGMISFALIVLGIQLSKTRISFKNYSVYLSNIIRLIGGPIIAFILIKFLNINNIMAQTLMVSSSLPTAINTALIAVEHNNEAEFASQAVMTSTILSGITLSIIVSISRMLFPI